MATTTTSRPVKKLGQLLEEQQEPFILEIYLSERGKNFNSIKPFKRSSKKGIHQFPKVFKVVYRKLASINKKSKDGKFTATEADVDQFSSASSTTVFNSCSESDAEEATTTSKTSVSSRVSHKEQKEVGADRENWRYIEESSRQISPDSVLEEMTSNLSHQSGRIVEENQPSKNCIVMTKKVSEDSILSASLWNLFFNSATEKPSRRELPELIKYKPAREFLKSKRVLQQTKQLLFDCVREVVETQSREKGQQNGREYLETQSVGKLICEKLKTWRRQSGRRVNITKLLESDYNDSVPEWNNFEQEIKDIALEIGDAVLEEIKEEIVTDMVYF